MNYAKTAILPIFLLASCNVGERVASASQATPESNIADVSMDAEDVVKARRTTFFLSTQAVGQIKAGIDEGGDLRRTQGGARMLAAWADALPTMFPLGTDLEASRALPTVWSDREGFKKAAVAYRDAATVLMEKAKEDDREGAREAFFAMADKCQACHKTYREADPAR